MIYYIALMISVLIGVVINSHYRYPMFKTINSNRNWHIVINKYAFHRKILYFIAALPFFLLSALRYGIGTDYFYGYVPCFNAIASGNYNATHLEKGYLLLNYLVSLFTKNYQWIFVVTSGLFIYLSFKAISTYSRNTVLSILIFFLSYQYFNSFNIVRQTLASAIVLMAIPWLYGEKKSDKIKFIIAVSCASAIHISSVLYLALLLIVNIDLGILELAISFGIVVIFKMGWVKIIQAFLVNQERYINYLRISIVQRSTSYYVLVVNIVLFLVIIYIDFRNSELSENREWRMIKWMQYIIILLIPFDGVVNMVGRVELLFMFPQFITITNAIEMHKYKKEKKYLIVVVLISFIIEYLFYYFTGSNEVFPYVSIFSKH